MSEGVRRSPDEHESAWRRNYWIILSLFGLSLLALLLLLVLLGIWWRSLRVPVATTRPTPSSPTVPAPPLPVAVISPQLEPTSRTVRFAARTRSGATWYVAAPSSGRLVELFAGPGGHVAAGQLLARVQTTLRVHRPPRPTPQRWITRPPDANAVAARAGAITRARERWERAESEVRAHTGDEPSAREAYRRAVSARDAARQDLTEAEAPVARARAELTERESAVRQAERLYRSGAASRAEMEDDLAARAAAATRLERAQGRAQAARSTLSAAESAVSNAEAEIETARQQLARARDAAAAARTELDSAESAPEPQPTTALAPSPAPSQPEWRVLSASSDVRAPVGGVVTGLLARRGAFVSRGATLMRVTRASGRHYRVEAPDGQVRGVQVGEAARLRHPTGRTYPGRVAAVAPIAGGRVAVEVIADGAPSVAPGGGEIAIELSVDGPTTRVIVPSRAVRRPPGGPVVWIASKDKTGAAPVWTAHSRRVRLGAVSATKAEIRAGIEPNSRVIIAGMEHLREGQQVSAVAWSLP